MITAIGNFRFNESKRHAIARIVVEDFAIKCATVLSEYCNPIANGTVLSTGVYELFNTRWGIKFVRPENTELVASLDSEDLRGYDFAEDVLWFAKHTNDAFGRKYETMYSYAYSISNMDDFFNCLCHFFGGGEFPFIKIYEWVNSEHQFCYLYEIVR